MTRVLSSRSSGSGRLTKRLLVRGSVSGDPELLLLNLLLLLAIDVANLLLLLALDLALLILLLLDLLLLLAAVILLLLCRIRLATAVVAIHVAGRLIPCERLGTHV